MSQKFIECVEKESIISLNKQKIRNNKDRNRLWIMRFRNIKEKIKIKKIFYWKRD